MLLFALAWASLDDATFDIICALVSFAVSSAKSASSILDNLDVEFVLDFNK